MERFGTDMLLRIILFLALLASPAYAQRGAASAPDPYALKTSQWENYNAFGRTLLPASTYLARQSTTLVLITGGQSLYVTEGLGSYSTVSARATNLSIGDGGVYPCANPVLGVQAVVSGGVIFTNSPNCIIADTLITNGSSYTDVIVVPMAQGSTLCADWISGGQWNHRIYSTVNRLKYLGLTPATGFTGTLRIDWGMGESDNQAGTSQGSMATCWPLIAQEFINAGTGASCFHLHTESIFNGVAAAAVTNSQATAIAGGGTIKQGANWDSLGTTVTNRQADLTHLNATGVPAAATLVATNIKNTSCP